ncbi:hypothetical protein [Accumulibacter sp.]|uniref:hypothetical protein n=1 Tax=Accumulibacter sp. TaxID=2053492 RepID=UPI0025E7886F|nr:hypothetical protein [Accumulibacter sp.]MCM8611441.1 hypothetical protein [Accumulibacter sp.]MCM8635359.1 hypothetical protein [Accumulibacter sp.]MCM8638796.1 hypothetical protein [Accumulibacter sp.]
MRLEDIAVRLRRRSAREAIDLGQGMLRQWAARVYGAWFATYWVAGLLLLAVWPWPGYVIALLWWLKPLFDRVLLHVYSRSLFGEACTVGDVLRALPRLLRAPGLISGLSLRRFSLARSLLLPVWQLEEQRGAAARARFALLGRRCHGHAAWLTFFCANMSSVLLLSLLFVLLALVPGEHPQWSPWDLLGDEESRFGHLLATLGFMLAETIIEPLYVASGFSLYINRRSELEGWDIELGLRRLAQRLEAKRVAAASMLALAVLTTGAVWLSPAPAFATTPPVDAQAAGDAGVAAAVVAVRPPAAAREVVDAVLAEPVFGQIREDWRWRWRRQESAVDEPRHDWLATLAVVAESVAEFLRGLLWVFAGLALAALVLMLVRYRPRQPARRSQRLPEFVAGVDLRPTALPAAVATAAAAALARGATVEALSLLYRGALRSLIVQRQIEFAAGDTEEDCLRRVAGQVPAAVEHCFAELVEAWRLVAYGGWPLPGARGEQLLAAWQRHFDGSGGQ